MRSQEQVDADAALTLAIEETARAYGVLEDGDVTGDYVVVVGSSNLGEEGELRSSYFHLLRNGSLAGYVAAGLLETAAFDIKMGRTDGD